VDGVAWHVDEAARAARDDLIAEAKFDLARDDVEGLLLLRWICGGGPPPGGTIASIAKYEPPVSSPVTRNR
jgi:hypothetical protein